MLEEIKREYNADLSHDSMALQRIKDAAEKAKIELSSVAQTQILLPFLSMVNGQPLNVDKTVTRVQFESLTKHLLERTRKPFLDAMQEAGLENSDIHQVLLVGGSTKMPAVQELVKSLSGKNPNLSINPDEVVALGASVQGAILAGDIKDILLLDVTPLTLSIETLGGVATPLIKRNTTIPFEKTQIFSTAADNQPSVDIHVVQGERPMASDNKSLGIFTLDGIKPAPKGTPQIQVTFSIDANGILNVKAEDKGTGKSNSITINQSSGLSDEDIQRIIKDAEINSEKDRKAKESAEVKNEAQSWVNIVETQLNDNKNITEDQRQDAQTMIRNIKDLIRDDKIEELKTSMEAIKKLSEKFVKNSEQTSTNEGSAEEPKEEEVVDVKVEE